MNTKTPECWSSDPNAHGVKIELSSERSLLLPFDQFAFAELKTEGKQQHLRLVFATHEVLVRGTCLRRIESAMQREELSLLARLPEVRIIHGHGTGRLRAGVQERLKQHPGVRSIESISQGGATRAVLEG